MADNQSKRGKNRILEYLPFLFFFALMLVGHLFMQHNFSDDAVSVKRALSRDTWGAMKAAYGTGRALFCRYLYSVYCVFLIDFAGGFFWRPALAFSYVCFAFGLSRVFPIHRLQPVWNNTLACCVTVLFPFAIMSETGWLTTSVVYIVPASVAMLAAIGIRKMYDEEIHGIVDWLLFGALLYAGTGHEQISALMAGLMILIFLNKVIHKKISFPLLLFTMISLIQLFRAATWPANTKRVMSETAAYFPNHPSLGLIDKLLLAFNHTMQHVFIGASMTLTVLACLVAAAVWKTHKDKFYRFLAILPVLISFGFRLGVTYFPGQFHTVNLDFQTNIDLSNFRNPILYISFGIVIWYICNMMINLYLVYGRSFASLFYAALFFGAVCTRMIMGLSASLYASGYRTALVMYLSFIILMFRMLDVIYNRSYENAINENQTGKRLYVGSRTWRIARNAVMILAVCSWFDFLLFV